MPQPYRGERPYPGDDWTLAQAPRDGQVVVCTCNLCRKLVRYLAADLAEILNPARDARIAPFTCSGCGRIDYVHVKLVTPRPGDVGHLPVRRPGPKRVIQTWRWVKLGDG